MSHLISNSQYGIGSALREAISSPKQGIASAGEHRLAMTAFILSEAMAAERHSVSGETWKQELAYVIGLISSDS